MAVLCCADRSPFDSALTCQLTIVLAASSYHTIDAGISMIGVIQAATLNSAESIGHGAEYGALETGKRADLILFDGDPLSDPQALLGRKVVIKDGVVWR